MKIIHRGTPPKEKVYRGECPKCESVFEASPDELTLQWGGQRDEYQFGQEKCTVCDYWPVNFYEHKTR